MFLLIPYNIFMKIVDKIKVNINKRISNLTNVQKLIYSIVFLIVMIFIIKFIFDGILKEKTLGVDYKNTTGNEIYTLSSIISDNDLYAQIKKAGDQFISKAQSISNDALTSKDINELYKYCLYSEYKDSISKNKFCEKAKDFYTRLSYKLNTDLEIVPDSITEYREEFYLLKFISYNNEEEFVSYLGIALDSDTKKFYIWYLE